jgi:predicted signal transduction protein with EAL and GGDEF domain
VCGLGNRAGFLCRLREAFEEGARNDFAVLVIELARIADIDDALGREARDAILREAGERISRAVGRHNVARIGALRFAVLARSVGSAADAKRLVDSHLMPWLCAPFRVEVGEFSVGASIGTALASAARDAETTLRNAEAAATRARDHDEPHVVYEAGITTTLTRKLGLERRLRGAIGREELQLHYQPKVRLLDGSIAGAEALMRWRDPELGTVFPSEFIPLLEESGMIREAGGWAMRQAVLDRGRWGAECGPSPRVAVNVSASQIRRDDFVAVVHDALRSAAGTCGLDLEITEGVVLSDVANCISKLAQVRELGVRVHVDDFGTGYSSLAYLARLPLDAIKIDRSFTASLPNDRGAMALVKAMIGLAHDLGLEVIAEGIETHDQADTLRRLGCDQGQGFFYSGAVPLDRMTSMVAHGLEAIAS